MSKLAHSYEPTMIEIDRRRLIEDGNEDLVFDFETDDLAPSRGICNAILIEFAAFLAIVAVWLLWWDALPGLTP